MGAVSREYFFFFQAEDGIRDLYVTGVQTCALPIFAALDDLYEALRGLGARALARGGPARQLDPAVAVHPALGAGPGRGTDQGKLPAVCRTPIGRGTGQNLADGQVRRDRPERRPLVAEPVA